MTARAGGDLRLYVEHVRAYGAHGAIVLAYILSVPTDRTQSGAEQWRRASVTQIAAGTALTHRQVRVALVRLQADGAVESRADSAAASFWAARR